MERHKNFLDNINKKINEYEIRIVELNDLIKKDNSSISKYEGLISNEKWKKLKGTLKAVGGFCINSVLSPFYLLGVESASYGIEKFIEGIDDRREAKKNIKNYEEKKQHQEEIKQDHEKEKKDLENEKEKKEGKKNEIEEEINKLKED